MQNRLGVGRCRVGLHAPERGNGDKAFERRQISPNPACSTASRPSPRRPTPSAAVGAGRAGRQSRGIELQARNLLGVAADQVGMIEQISRICASRGRWPIAAAGRRRYGRALRMKGALARLGASAKPNAGAALPCAAPALKGGGPASAPPPSRPASRRTRLAPRPAPRPNSAPSRGPQIFEIITAQSLVGDRPDDLREAGVRARPGVRACRAPAPRFRATTEHRRAASAPPAPRRSPMVRRNGRDRRDPGLRAKRRSARLRPAPISGKAVSIARKAALRPALSPSKQRIGSSAIFHRRSHCSAVSAVPSGATTLGKPAAVMAMTST